MGSDLKKRKKVKVIKIDVGKCTGCRKCELMCSAFHAKPKYSSTNPARSRIRVILDEVQNIHLPVFAGEYTEAECNVRNTLRIDGKEYRECWFCRACCPSREDFTEPDSGLPLKCDACEEEPPLAEPVCVKWCVTHALTYEEREEEQEEEGKPTEMEVGLEALVNKYGLNTVKKALTEYKRGETFR